MPIYEYLCSNCGHRQEFLQKLGETPRTRCTQCGQETFSKMVTAAGFQLKGSGWYATDFKSAGAKPAQKADGAPEAGEGGKAVAAAPGSEAKKGGKEATAPSGPGTTAASP